MPAEFSTISCGIIQLSGMPESDEEAKQKVKQAIDFFCGSDIENYRQLVDSSKVRDLGATKAAIFSDTVDIFPYGERMKRYIETHKLGTVETTRSWYNTTGNKIKLYLWIFDLKAMWEHIYGKE